MAQITKNFTTEEIACKCGCGLSDIDLRFMDKVQQLRDAYGKPMRIASGVRCPDHNKKVGGTKNSRHMPTPERKAMALDVLIGSTADRHRFLRMASMVFGGIGVHNAYIHIDGREDEEVCWVY